MGYAGWVHIRGETEGVWAGERHFDTTAGTSVELTRGPGGLVVRMYEPAERKETVYRETDGAVRIADLHAGSAEQLVAMARKHELTIDDVIAGQPGAVARRTGEGELDRYEVSVPAEDPVACADGRCARSAVEGVVWTDAATGLVRRTDLLVGGKRMRCEYTYGGPAIRDVYDLGVPREARVVDNRPDAATREVLDRLRRRYEAGFGDYAAVATETPVGEDGRPIGEGGFVHLYARSGAAFLANRYGVGFPRGRSCGGGMSAPRPERPAGWPTPELGVVLGLLNGQKAMGVFVGDGERVWSGQQTDGHGTITEMAGRLGQVIPMEIAKKTLPGLVWPTREGLGAYGPDTRIETVRDRGRPGLIGLRMDRLSPYSGADVDSRRRMSRDVTTFWLDPLRDDVPVEATWQAFAKGSPDELEIEGRTTYTDWARTRDGRWYPAAWRAVTRFNRADNRSVMASDWRLRVWAGEQLGAEWFSAPAAKEGDHPPTATASGR